MTYAEGKDSLPLPQAFSQFRSLTAKIDSIENVHPNISSLYDTVKMLQFNTEIMRNLMMDLLDLAQMENNTFKLNKDFFNIFDVINAAFNVVSHVSTKKKIELVAPVVNDEDSKYFMQIYGDKNRFIQVIINFLSNSLKFSDVGSRVNLFLHINERQTLTSI